MDNQDVNKHEEETLNLTSEAKETELTEEKKEEERTVPLTALQEERRKRQELERRIGELETSINSKPASSDEENPDLDLAVDKLEPYFRKRGFLTRAELEEEKTAESYANEMKTLTEKYSGKDGRPAFDAYEVAEFGKKNKIFNLEVAYEQMHKKELLDWQLKKADSSDAPQTESGTSGIKETGNTPILTREALQKKLDSARGREWWEENREKVIAAMQRGEIS